MASYYFRSFSQLRNSQSKRLEHKVVSFVFCPKFLGNEAYILFNLHVCDDNLHQHVVDITYTILVILNT